MSNSNFKFVQINMKHLLYMELLCCTLLVKQKTIQRHTLNKSTQVSKFRTSLKFGLENMQPYLFLRFMNTMIVLKSMKCLRCNSQRTKNSEGLHAERVLQVKQDTLDT